MKLSAVTITLLVCSISALEQTKAEDNPTYYNLRSIFRTPKDDAPSLKRNYDDFEILERSSFHSEASDDEPKNIYKIKDSPKAAANAHIHVRFGDQSNNVEKTSTKITSPENPILNPTIEEAVKKFILLLFLPMLRQSQKSNFMQQPLNQLFMGDAKYSKRNTDFDKSVELADSAPDSQVTSEERSKANEGIYSAAIEEVFKPVNGNKIEKLQQLEGLEDTPENISNSLDGADVTAKNDSANNKPMKFKFDDVDIDGLNVYRTVTDGDIPTVKTTLLPITRPLAVHNEPNIGYTYVPVVNYYPVPVSTQYKPRVQYLQTVSEKPQKSIEDSDSYTIMTVPVVVRKSRQSEAGAIGNLENHTRTCACSYCSQFARELNDY